MKSSQLASVLLAALALAACQKQETTAALPAAAAPAPAPLSIAPPAPAQQPFRITASIQDLRDAVIAPAGDALGVWVEIPVSERGPKMRHPRSDEQGQEA